MASNYAIKGTVVETMVPNQTALESLNAGEIAELWAKLTEAAKTDP